MDYDVKVFVGVLFGVLGLGVFFVIFDFLLRKYRKSSPAPER